MYVTVSAASVVARAGQAPARRNRDATLRAREAHQGSAEDQCFCVYLFKKQ